MQLAAFILYVVAFLLALIALLWRPAAPNPLATGAQPVALVLACIAGILTTYGAYAESALHH